MSQPAARRRLIRISFALAAMTLLARLLGGVLQIAIAARFGTSAQLDAYLVAMSLPTIIAEWFILAAPAVVLVPLLAELRRDGLEDEAWRLICSLANVLMLVVLGLIVVAYVAGSGVVTLLAPGLGDEGTKLAASLLRWTSLILIPALGSGVIRAMLNSRERFLAPSIAVGVTTGTAITFVLALSEEMGVYAIVAGMLVGASAGLLVNAVASRGLWRRWYVGTDIRGVLARRSASLLVTFLLIGTAAQINFISDRFFASFLDAGSISTLEYGEKLASFFMLVFASAVAVPAYTALSRQAAERDVDEVRSTVVASVRLVAVVTLPVLAICVVLREPIVSLLLERGAFSAADVSAVATVFGLLCFAWLVYAFAQVLTYAFFSLQETWRFLVVVVAGIAANILLDIVLVGPLGVPGLAIATASAAIVSNTILWVMLTRRLEGPISHDLLVFGAKVCLSALAAGAAAYGILVLLGPWLETDGLLARLAAVALPGAAAILVFLGVARISRVEEIGHIRDSLMRKVAPDRSGDADEAGA